MAQDLILEIAGLNMSFAIKGERVPVLRDVDLSVGRGEFVSIVGPSGCGKSTLLRLIMALVPRDSGTVRIDGEDVSTTSPKCSLIFQEPRLLPWLTVRENIDFVLPRSTEAAERREIVQRNIELVGLVEFADALPSQLSGGMQQRASIARGLATTPELLLLDEPFGALDAFTRMGMQTELIRIWQQEKATMVLVTHDIDEAIYLSTKIAVFSARPGTILQLIDVDLPPTARDRSSEPFTALRRRVLKALFGGESTLPEYVI